MAAEPCNERSREEEERELIDTLARKILEKGLETPAVFFLEVSKPLSFVASQAMIFLGPLVQAVLPWKNYRKTAELFEKRENVERLIQAIEAGSKKKNDDEKE